MPLDRSVLRSRAALLTTEEMARADQLTIEAGATGLALMEQAGRALAEKAIAGRSPGSLLVLAGPGNNGGDGFVAARYAERAGWRVRVGLVGESHQLRGDAAQMASQWHGPRRKAAPDLIDGSDVIVDAIFGAGLSRDITGPAAELIEAINHSGLPVIAADVPSGVDGNTGGVRGVAVRADRTVTFFRAKPGHCLMPGRALCGDLKIVDIGIPDAVLDRIGGRTFRNGPAFWGGAFPRLDPLTHKHARGHTMVVSGGPLNTGAARLAAMGALRAGAGLVTVLSPPEAAVVNATHLTAIMVSAFDSPEKLLDLVEGKAASVVIGPAAGVTAPTRDHVLGLLSLKIPLVLDADALTVFARTPETLFRSLHDKVVLTPHWGEFRRLFPNLTPDRDLAPDQRLTLARQAAEMAGATVLLKGPDTVVAAADQGADKAPPWVSITTNAPPDLATAGSGDVLAGIIAGLMAQGMEAFTSASAGAWLHGEAGRHAGRGLIAEDLPAHLPGVLGALDGM